MINITGIWKSDDTQEVVKIMDDANLAYEFSHCPPSLGEIVKLPILRDINDRGYFGIRAIRLFVERSKNAS